MPAPTNISAATATVIPALPYATTQDVNDGGLTYTVWYAYTAVPGEVEIGVFGFGDLTIYTPGTYPYTGPAEEPNRYLSITGLNVPVQVPVTPGLTYYFEFRKTANVTPAVLTINALTAPTTPAVPGSLLIPDDAHGFPAVVRSGVDGSVQRFVNPFPAAGVGDVLAVGTLCVDTQVPRRLEFYTAAFALVTVAPFGTSGNYTIRTHVPTQTWTVGRANGSGVSAIVSTFSGTGVQGATTWTLHDVGLTAVAATVEGTRLYYAGTGAAFAPLGAGSPIFVWDLVTNVQLADFAAGVAGYLVGELFALADGTLLASYFLTSGARTFFVRHYGPAGAVLRTFTFAESHTPTMPQLSLTLDADPSFWVWRHPTTTPGMSVFTKFRVSDGAMLQTFTVEDYARGAYAPPATLDPVRFGNAGSCPVIVLRVGDGGGPGPGPGPEPEPEPEPEPGPGVAPSYHLEARYIRRLRRAPHLNNENLRVFYRRFELDLERGQALATGQGSEPYVLLRISRDGGQTWGEEQRMAAGQLGEYQARVIARRLGHARDLVFEVVVSDPVAWSLVGAWLDLEPGAH